MALQGNFQDFGLPDIFQLISLQRKSGILTIRSEKETIRIVFHEGHIIEADSEPKRLEDRLGQVLVRTGRITQEQLDQALAMQQRTLKRLGLVLLDLGFVDEQTLKKALEVQISQTVYRTFRWKSGEYNFETDTKVTYDPRIDVMLSTDNILMEGIQIVDEWPVIQRKIPDFKMVFRPLVDPASITVEERRSEDDFEFSLEATPPGAKTPTDQLVMSADEFQVFSKVDGRRKVQDIMDEVPLPEFTTLKYLYEFYNRGLIEPLRAPRAAQVVRVEEPGAGLERPGLLRMTPFLALVFVGVAAVLSVLNPFYPYDAPRKPPPYQIATNFCAPDLGNLIMGYYLLYSREPSTPEEVTPDPIHRQCLKDPLGRPVHFEFNESSVSASYLGLHGRESLRVQVPIPHTASSIVTDPLSSIEIRTLSEHR